MTTPMSLESTDVCPTRRSDRVLAAVCLAAADYLVRLKFDHLVRLIRRAKRACRPAATQEAIRYAAAVHHAARHRSGRVACLEYSLAAVLLAIIHRRSLDWCIGARLMPYASHAWIEADRRAVGEPDRDRPYHLLLRV